MSHPARKIIGVIGLGIIGRGVTTFGFTHGSGGNV